MDFSEDNTSYIIKQHALENWKKRTGNSDEQLETSIKNGKIVLETEKHRYVVNDGLMFPCYKIGKNEYRVKTILVDTMNVKDIDGMIKRGILKIS